MLLITTILNIILDLPLQQLQENCRITKPTLVVFANKKYGQTCHFHIPMLVYQTTLYKLHLKDQTKIEN